MAVILALDTSTEACSCALQIEGETLEDYAHIPRQHAQNLLPMIHRLMQSASVGFADIDAIAFGRGPGSFTGLRIAAGVAQGLALATALPVIPISTLAALALDAHEQCGATGVLACLDARIDEVYWGWYCITFGLPVLLGQEVLSKPELLQLPMSVDPANSDNKFTAAGNGLIYKDRFAPAAWSRIDSDLPDILPRAGCMARLAAVDFARGLAMTAELASPVYLRDKVTRH